MQTKTNKNNDLFLNEKETECKNKIFINTITVYCNIKFKQLDNCNRIEQNADKCNFISFNLI